MIETTDHARQLIKDAGITVDNVTDKQLGLLFSCIDERMRASGNYHGTYKMHGKPSKFMTCRTNKWIKREAVSFNTDGFIGFAGWSDSKNIRPILDGVSDWLSDCAALKNSINQ